MAIKIDCPRCKQNLLVPNKKAGSYAVCPRCAGRFWVPPEATGESGTMEAAAAAGGGSRAGQETAVAAPPPPAPPRGPAGAAAAAVFTAPAASRPRPSPPAADRPPPAAAPPSAAGGHKVARFISAETAESVLKPAVDGRLPDLHLQESDYQAETQSQAKSLNPLVLYGALTLSAVLSLVLALGNWSSTGPENSGEKNTTRKIIEDRFFGGGNADLRALKPYQELLRAAKRAHDSQDFKTEVACYKKVRKMLHGNRGTETRPLTGDGDEGRKSDRELETCIETLLQGTGDLK